MEMFVTWAQRNREEVETRSYKDDAELREIVERFLTVYTPKAHQCYHNAAKLCAIDPEMEYVVGWARTSNDTIEHAWNRWRGIHFDLTQEIGFKGRAAIRSYIKVACVSAAKLREFVGLWTAPTLFDAYIDEVAPLPPIPTSLRVRRDP